MTDYINGGRGYQNIADFVILTDKQPFNFNILKQDAIIFCKTDYIDFLFNNIKFSSKKYILITHYSDYYIDNSRFSKRPPCIKKWYAVATAMRHPDLIQIPVGFGVHWIPFPTADEALEQWYFNNAERLKYIDKDEETVHCNFTIDNFRPPRHQVTSKIMANGVKCYTPPNNNTGYGRLTFPEYCEDMAKYRFVASPPGNGIDAHRNWEALYMGCIPIVIKNLIYETYDLPIIQVNDYSEVTSKLLKDYLDYFHTHEFKWEQLTLSYWKNKMLKDLNIK